MIKGEGALIDSIMVTQESATGIEEHNSEITIYPVPASNKLLFNINDTSGNFIGEVSLTSTSGGVVLKKTITATDARELDVSNITNGLYVLMLKNNDHVYYKKIIIKRPQ